MNLRYKCHIDTFGFLQIMIQYNRLVIMGVMDYDRKIWQDKYKKIKSEHISV